MAHRAIVGLGVRLTTRRRLVCLDAAIRHASIVGPERAISHRRNERLSMFNTNGSFLLAMLEFFLFFAWFMCLWWILADIFRSNAGKAGLLAAQVDKKVVQRIWDHLDAHPGATVTVDLESRTVRAGDGPDAIEDSFDIDDYTRWRLLEGLDEDWR